VVEVRKRRRRGIKRSNSKDWGREDRYVGGDYSRGIVG